MAIPKGKPSATPAAHRMNSFTLFRSMANPPCGGKTVSSPRRMLRQAAVNESLDTSIPIQIGKLAFSCMSFSL